ncbi:TRI39 ligase, partial [Heliornis fulica]|nr:TRI39 ligase [Heliornis fulica]
QIQDLKYEIEKRKAKNSTELSEGTSQLDAPTQGKEEKSQRSVSESSQGGEVMDFQGKIDGCGKVTFQLPELEERPCHFSWRSGAPKEALKKLQAIVTLDPDTAHPDLVVSEDRKSVRRGEGHQDLPEGPGRFNYWPFVLGCP